MNALQQMSMFDKFTHCKRILTGFDEFGDKTRTSMFDRGVISFAQADGIRRPHPSIIAAGVRAILDTSESSLDSYLFLQRIQSLDQMIIERFINEGVDEEIAQEICIDSGTIRICLAYLNAIAKKGDIFLAGQAFYRGISGWCHTAGVDLRCVPTQKKNEYKLTAEDLTDWYAANVHCSNGKKPKGIFLFNPTPTGAIYNKLEFADLAKFISENDLVALEDSIFMGTEFDPNATRTHLAACREVSHRVVTVTGTSKAYSLANMRIGWGCGPKAIIEKMNTYITATTSVMPQIAKLMALAALKSPRSYLLTNAQECKERAYLVTDLVEKANEAINSSVSKRSVCRFIDIEHMPKAGHSILLSFNQMKGLRLDDGSTITNSIDITRYFLDEAKVALSPCFDSGFDDCEVRLSFGCVGSEHTYAWTQNIEAITVLESTLPYVDKELANYLQMHLDHFKVDKNLFYSDEDNRGFFCGRQIITEGIMQRITPAIIRLISGNEKQISKTRKIATNSNFFKNTLQY